MLKFHWHAAAAALSAHLVAAPAAAQDMSSAPTVRQDRRLKIQPMIDVRARYEVVDQGPLDAEAFTLRLRAGAEARVGRLSLLAEGEATAAPITDYNAFPFLVPGERQWRPGHAVIADPANVELNRLQLQFKAGKDAVTLGRQRINLDDQRWVGSVGWRQSEQTFDAVRGEAQFGQIAADLSYAIGQRTIFGSDAGARTYLAGDFVFAGLSSKLGPLQGKAFAYFLDYDEPFAFANSSQTYGTIVSASVPLGARRRLSLRASHARQSDLGKNPFDYAADYWSVEAGTTLAGFLVTGGWEQLGSDNGRAVQTPMATLHKFNGWADLFLTTPAAGLEDTYVSLSRKFDGAKLLPGLNANLVFHQFDSSTGGIEYGTEWDASVGFKFGTVGVLLKYAHYDAAGLGSDTRKLWLQAEWVY
jgi:hypothetical protein